MRCAFVAAVMLLVVRIGFGAAPTIGASEDTWVSEANPTNNYGAAGALEVSATGLSQGRFVSVLKFDTGPIKTSLDATYGPGQWTVQQVTLGLVTANPINPIFNANVAGSFEMQWMQNDSWVEGTGTPTAPTTTGLTYATLPGFVSGADQSLGTFSFSGGTSGTNTWSLGLSPGLLSDITGGSLASIHIMPADASVSYLVNSRNFTNAAQRPVLTVTAVPEPSAAGLLTLGGVAAMRRRR